MVTFFCGLNTSLFVFCLVSGGISSKSLLAVQPSTLAQMGAKVPQLMRYNYQIWRFIMPMALHADLVHLLSNTLSLVLLGQSLEQDLGSLNFSLLYFLSGFGGILFSALCDDNMAVGASTCIFGLIGSYVSCLILNWTYFKNNQD